MGKQQLFGGEEVLLMNGLGRQLARMMWWHGLASYPTVALSLSGLAWTAFSLGFAGSPYRGVPATVGDLIVLVAGLISLVAAGAIGVCWVVALWHIFWAGKMAFGVWCGLVYSWLALVLSPWPGLYVIPHMVRLDVRRLLGVEPEVPSASTASV
jgi:hypothetical protein